MDELDIVNAFVVAAKRERYAGFVSSPKARRKFIEALSTTSGISIPL